MMERLWCALTGHQWHPDYLMDEQTLRLKIECVRCHELFLLTLDFKAGPEGGLTVDGSVRHSTKEQSG